jgi:glycosyltransferase involved in cell wall biosynthesis
MKDLSIVIAYHNEGTDFIMELVSSIQSTIDVNNYEIIIVDDGSITPLLPFCSCENIKIINHRTNKGVGAAFDTGVARSFSENIILLGSDIRFYTNNWASELLKRINENQKSLICTSCVGLNEKNMDFSKRRLTSKHHGATLLLFNDKNTNPSPSVSSTFKSILDAKWQLKDKTKTIYEIPVILGAAYGVKKSWYEYIDGFWGHKKWGSLEPYISLKSWMFGGNCIIDTTIEIAHIFKLKENEKTKINTPALKDCNFHEIKQEEIFHNKFLIIELLFDDTMISKIYNYIGNNNIILKAKQLLLLNLFIKEKRIDYRNKIVFSLKEFCNKFKITIY